MTKLLSVLLATLLSFVTFSAHAGLYRLNLEEQAFRNAEGEYLIVNNPNKNDEAYGAVVSVIEKAGYRMTNGIEPGTKTDTWCKVDVYQTRQILGECYTPHMGHGVAVRNDLAWTREEFKGDYSGVPALVAQLRDEHRRASAAINTK